MSSKSQRPQGHIYEFKDWEGVGSLPNGDLKILVTLKDTTANRILKISGIIQLVGAVGTMSITSLEGYSPVFINVSKHSKRAKIHKHSSGKYVKYCLEDA